MRPLAILFATVAAATAQSPLTTTFFNNSGGANGGGVYFDLTANDPAGITICQLDLNFHGAPGTVASIDVFTGGSSSVPHTQAWTLAATGALVTAGVGQPTNVVLIPSIFIAGGTTVGIAVRSNGVAHAYSVGANNYPVPGNVYGAGQPLELNAGQASNVLGVGAVFTPRVVNTNIYYFSGALSCPPVATVEDQGPGCDAKWRSFYELMDRANFDLDGGCLEMINAGGDYAVTFDPSCPLFPVGALSTPVVLALTDDSQVVVPGASGLVVGSNGWVALGGGNSNSFWPSAFTMVDNPSTAFYCWKDLDPTATGSGPVVFEEAGNSCRITFDGVYTFGGTTPADAVNIQFTYDKVTGDMIMGHGATPSGGTEWLVGYSPGGPDLIPPETDLSGLAPPNPPLLTFPVDQPPLALTAVGRPVQGPANTPFDVVTGDIPATALMHLGIVGLQRPGIPLVAVGIQAPNCLLNASLDVVLGPAFGPFPGGTLQWQALQLPACPALCFFGFEFNCQGVIFGTPKNSAFGPGVLTSNGLKCVVGGL